MKILAATPWVPSERRPRSLGLLAELAARHDLRLVSAVWSAEDDRDLAKLPYPTAGVRFRRGTAIARAAIALASRNPLQQAYLSDPRMATALRDTATQWRPDVLYLNTLRSAQWRHLGLSPEQVIDLDEFRSEYYRMQSVQSANPVKKIVYGMEAKRMRAEEGRIVSAFSRVIVSSPRDLGQAENVDLVRSPHALEAAPAPQADSRQPTIVFVGRMSYSANADAVKWFVSEVMPLILKREPTAKFDIVGDAPPSSVTALKSPSVRVLGRVPSVAEHYAAATVSVVPVTAATGIQMKLIEALTLGTPTVTTPLVARQADVAPGKEVSVATAPQEWADRVIELFESDTLRAQRSEAGRAWAHENHSREAISEAFLRSWAKIR